MTPTSRCLAARLPRHLPFVAAFAAVLLAAATLLSACGGGVGVGGTGTYASGPIAGFGSIVVNDIRFDDSAAAVVDADGSARSRGDLRLGMTVEVDGGPLAADGTTATATRVRIASALVGAVQAVDVAAGRLRVLGQVVALRSDTVFDDRLTGGLASLRVGDVVEVYGSEDRGAAVLAATRIEPRVGVSAWRVRAVLDALDPAARTLRIGNQVFSFAGVALPADAAVGRVVLLSLAPALDGSGRAVITGFGVALPTLPDLDDVRLRGRITAFTSTTAFAVDGQAVDASAAQFPQGTAGLGLGARVEVRGVSVGRVLRALLVRSESDDEVRERGVELEGAIEAVDPVASSFRLRGLTIRTTRPDLRLDDGTLADLVVGRRVEVKAQLAPDRIALEATRIKFE